jgi:shikimate dehydrogenase
MSSTDRFYLAGVMGMPIMHSRSPLMHNYWLKQQGMTGSYVPLAISPGGLHAALRALHPLGFSGCNLTIPHKQEALNIVDEVSESGRRIGAISCVTVRADGSLLGSNNDALGFIRNLQEARPDWRAQTGAAVVIGAGGGSRAICDGLLQAGAPEIRLVNRNDARAQQLAETFGRPLVAYPWSARHQVLEGAALLVNTTSQGMVGQTPLDLQLDALPLQALVTDIVYAPLQTPLLAAAHQRGNPTVDGLGMLLHQGPAAWQSWFGLEPKVTPELRALVVQSLIA